MPASLLCPACQADLVMAERQGIEIDYRPKRRGVWLDRGELEKIVERAGVGPSRAVVGSTSAPARLRSTSWTPRRRSISASWALEVGWLTPTRSAARRK